MIIFEDNEKILLNVILSDEISDLARTINDLDYCNRVGKLIDDYSIETQVEYCDSLKLQLNCLEKIHSKINNSEPELKGEISTKEPTIKIQ